ncbi:HCP-like protein [Backusella circina FSU 941]|nr:HCP-like protein [Backusella circina FSU 941]
MEAQFKLGDLYALGHGTPKSFSDAYQWYTKAAIQGYKKALIRIHNLYQEDIRIYCRGQINSDEKKWTDDDFKMSNNIRELYEYRIEKKKAILSHAIYYYTSQFKQYQASNQGDPNVQLNLAFLYQHGYGVKKCIRWAFEYYALAAEQGDIDAQYNLGTLYQKRTNMKFNYQHAFKWYTESAKGGNRAAQKYLAYFYLKGLATDIDYDIALSWYIKAAEAGDSEAQVILGKLYRKGDYIKRDLSVAVKWYLLAARQGNIVAQNCLSQLQQRGMISNIKLEKEDMSEYVTEGSLNKRLCTKLSMDISKLGAASKFKQLNKLAKYALIGDGPAMYEIGLKYYHGGNEFIQNRDQETGIKWIKNAANTEHKDALLLIAELYKKGDSIEQDYHKASIQYKSLAKQKDADGQCNVGIMYNEGLGVREDPLEASKWFMWAADQGNASGQYNLGMLTYLGRGLRQDEKTSINLLYQLACMRNPQACFQLGSIYFYGLWSVVEDKKIGIILWDFAAKNGDTHVQWELANKFKEGTEVKQNIQKYIRYLTMAATSGSGKAQYHLAIAYLKGYGAQHDHFKAYNLFKQASDNGHLFSQWIFKTPMEYDYDVGEISKIIDMFAEITKEGIDDLSYNIGSTYEHGVRNARQYVFNIDYTKAEEWYLAASNKGDARADYRLGIMHELGRGVEKNLRVAMKYYKRASIKENSNAICRLAYIYLSGHSVTRYRLFCMSFNGYHINRDLLKAFHLYTKASAMGHEEATKALTVLKSYKKSDMTFDVSLEKDLQIIFDKENQISMLEKATEEGYTGLQYQIGIMYENDNNISNAIKWLSLAADIGVTDAYYRLGTFYEDGRGAIQDCILAAKMYHRAAEKDHEDACYRLAQLYQYGKGVKIDYLKAYQFYKMSADLGHIEAYKVLNITLETKTDFYGSTEQNFFNPSTNEYQASLFMCKHIAEHGDTDVQFQVGFAYEYSVLEPNYMEAYKWYTMAKDSHKDAMYHLGLLYEKGLGVSQSYQKSNQLYQQASQLGSSDALYQLGNVYRHGRGVEIDSEKAIRCYTRAAKLGDPKHQCELGSLYEDGELVQKSILEALKWYTKAYLQGYDRIGPKLDTMDVGKPYEDFFFKKLFRNLRVASCGYFRLNENYEYGVYSGVNYRLGSLYAFGQGTDKNLRMAWDYFSKKYDRFHGALIENFLFLKYNGLSSSQKSDILKAFEEDEVFVNQMNVEEQYTFGMIFFDGIVHTQNIVRENVKKGYTPIDAQDKNDPSQYIVIERDYSRAFRCLKKAGDKNHAEALLQLGVMYHCGYGVDQNSEQGERYFDKATVQDAEFMGPIATLYHISKEIQNFTKAFEWYKRLEKRLGEELDETGRDKTNERVQSGLGLLYEYGNGVEQDYQKAIAYYKKLTDVHMSIGTHRLALMYYYGKGVPVDYKESFDLFKKAIPSWGCNLDLPFVYDRINFDGNNSQNNRIYCTMNTRKVEGESYYYLGVMYNNGEGTPQDKGMAQFYFGEAFKQGCERAKYKIEK